MGLVLYYYSVLSVSNPLANQWHLLLSILSNATVTCRTQ